MYENALFKIQFRRSTYEKDEFSLYYTVRVRAAT